MSAISTVSLTATANLIGMLPLFVGMVVRISANIPDMSLLTHEVKRVVVSIMPHAADELLMNQSQTANSSYPTVLLSRTPKAVLVELLDPELQEVQFCSRLAAGHVWITPQKGNWDYDDTTSYERHQLPLAPAYVNTQYGLQGQTARKGIVIFLSRSPGQGDSDHFLSLCVLMSRATKLSDILLVDLPERDLFAEIQKHSGTLMKRMELFRDMATQSSAVADEII